jgi:hypothetical protein
MSTWHAAPHVLARFATKPEDLDNVTASSVEEHLIACEQCRRAVAAAAEPATITASWNAIADQVDRPPRPVGERLLGWFFPDDMARVVAATPALRLSWLAAVIAVVAAVVAVTRSAGSPTPFLALAPLVPLAGVAISFGPAPDPAGEAALATPMHGAGLVLRRTVVVLATSLPIVLVGALALPALEWRSVGWVLPAIALSVAALALSTWLPPLTSTVTTFVAWETTLFVAGIVDRSPRAVSDGPVFGPAGQLAFALIIPLMVAVLGVRQLRLATMEAR